MPSIHVLLLVLLVTVVKNLLFDLVNETHVVRGGLFLFNWIRLCACEIESAFQKNRRQYIYVLLVTSGILLLDQPTQLQLP